MAAIRRNFMIGVGVTIMVAAVLASYTASSGKLTAFVTGATTVVAGEPASPGT
jgi:hypothetical protein